MRFLGPTSPRPQNWLRTKADSRIRTPHTLSAEGDLSFARFRVKSWSIAMYHQNQGRDTTGVHLVTLGITPLFRPWFFDGSTVYWGTPCQTYSAALEAAEILKVTYQ